MPSTQYIKEAWAPYTLTTGDEIIDCNLNANPDGDDDTTLIIIPTQAHDAVKDPAGTEFKPNVMTPWLDLMTDAGFHVILMHGYYNDDLNRLAAMANDGIDGFAGMDHRIAAVMDDAYEKGLYREGRVVLAGSSRHGFAVLHAHANLPNSAAAIAIGPVIWWPRLKEFHGMDDHPIVTKHSLYELAFKMPPRPVLVQIGNDDDRVGQDLNHRFIGAALEAYGSSTGDGPFTVDRLGVPGHSGPPTSLHSDQHVITWLARLGFL